MRKPKPTFGVDVPTLWLLPSALSGANLLIRGYSTFLAVSALEQSRLTRSRSKENMRKFLARFPNGFEDFEDDTAL